MGKRRENGALPSALQVRVQLDRILASDIFTRSERLSAFLRFVVEQTLNGQGLKEQVLGSELYGKGTEFAGASDPIVRVDARRLRDKLREYYAEFPEDPILISLPRGSYVPVFKQNDVAPDAEMGTPRQVVYVSRQPRWRWLAVSIGLAAVVGAGLAWSVWYNSSKPADRAVVITQGVNPDISADGRFVVFSLRAPEDSTVDLWVQDIDGQVLRRLTRTPQVSEDFPAWSPDGREIAFVRFGQGIFVVPQSGGAERKVSSGTWVDWAPDGKSLLVRDREREGPFSVYQDFLETGDRRRLTVVLGGGRLAMRRFARWIGPGAHPLRRFRRGRLCRPYAGRQAPFLQRWSIADE
jgi:hypothetical protein